MGSGCVFRKAFASIVLVVLLFTFMLPITAYSIEDDSDYAAEVVSKIADETNVLDLKAKSAILVDANTGTVLLEHNSHERMSLASVTKIMSMLLIMEAIDSGKLKYEDKVPVSEHASSMGGTQVWLEPGEVFTVEEMLKAVVIRSANDCTVALAEKIAGSEEAFVDMMNKRAKELGMNDTNFLDCTGLAEIENDGHYSSAYDIAIMSRELLMKHPDITKFTKIWQANFREGVEGKKPVSLDNTNKLIRFYEGANGLKTGYTRKSGYCLAASAKRNNLQLIAVVLGEPDSNTRFAEARKLLDHGFANFETAKVNGKGEVVQEVVVKKGLKEKVNVIFADDVYLLLRKGNLEQVTRELNLNADIAAPIKAGQKLGEVIYRLNEMEVGKADLVAETEVERATFIRLFYRMLIRWFAIGRK
ncbi:MAG TPA: D-alanyl-D-alanine carboxypeptidase [Clostridiaceae bacterium]|nr:D-alanyl-D-alanine carboxypeptidase [Clostridiaceae bacterium]